MAIIVVGGHSRNIGKTSVVAGLIAAIPERRWTALKISPHQHTRRRGQNSFACSITVEHDSGGEGDTSRFLRAGALRALWVQIKPGHMAESVAAIKLALIGSGDTIFESNRIVEFIHPQVYLQVLEPSVRDFKASAIELLPQVDGFVLHQTAGASLGWDAVPQELIRSKPVFPIQSPQYVTPELIAFVREKISLESRVVGRG